MNNLNTEDIAIKAIKMILLDKLKDWGHGNMQIISYDEVLKNDPHSQSLKANGNIWQYKNGSTQPTIIFPILSQESLNMGSLAHELGHAIFDKKTGDMANKQDDDILAWSIISEIYAEKEALEKEPKCRMSDYKASFDSILKSNTSIANYIITFAKDKDIEKAVFKSLARPILTCFDKGVFLKTTETLSKDIEECTNPNKELLIIFQWTLNELLNLSKEKLLQKECLIQLSNKLNNFLKKP